MSAMLALGDVFIFSNTCIPLEECSFITSPIFFFIIFQLVVFQKSVEEKGAHLNKGHY
jgi:hypothetical protein